MVRVRKSYILAFKLVFVPALLVVVFLLGYSMGESDASQVCVQLSLE